MFEGEVAELDAEAALAAAARLRASADRAEADLLAVAAHYADLHPASATCWSGALPGMERGRVMGGDGCPEVGEFASVELGAALGVSSGAAASLMEDALALRHRLPRVWSRVHDGEVQAWRARKIAQTTRRLSRAAAAVVDARVAPIAQSVTPYRLDLIVRAAIVEVDPDQAQADADNEGEGRGVWAGQSDLCGTKTMVIRAAAGDVVRLDATTDQIAECLARLGDTDSLDARRAKAIGWLAQPQAALELWATATSDLPHASTHPGADTSTDKATSPGTDMSTGPRIDREVGMDDDARSIPGRGDALQASTCSESELPPVGRRTSRTGLGGAVTVYVHLTDQTLATGTGVLRTTARTSRSIGGAEGGSRDSAQSVQLGALLAPQLAELIGGGRDRIVVIDLNDRVSADAYEIVCHEHGKGRYVGKAS